MCLEKASVCLQSTMNAGKFKHCGRSIVVLVAILWKSLNKRVTLHDHIAAKKILGDFIEPAAVCGSKTP